MDKNVPFVSNQHGKLYLLFPINMMTILELEC